MDDGGRGKEEEKESPIRPHVTDELRVTAHAYTHVFFDYIYKNGGGRAPIL